MRKRLFIKQMTPAEAGDTKTHEKYVRLPNNFDHQSFFQQEGVVNGSVIQIDFEAAYNGNQNELIPLKFVYYANSNLEKRIPSLGPIFDKYNVTASDVVCLESITDNGQTLFSISFKQAPELKIATSPIYYEMDECESITARSGAGNYDGTQIIYYGCPGSGKSHKVKVITNTVNPDYVFRTTFHPDTDYASFVGCYKPCSSNRSLLNGNDLTEDELLQRFFDSKDEDKYKGDIKARYLYESLINAVDIKNLGENASTIADKLKSKGFDKTAYVTEANCMYKIHNWLKEEGYLVESNITYEFLPQVFTNAYIKAWKNPEEKVYLIIEEINRGNCAQIFGDLFQLLDRDKVTGKSEYPIKADKDLVAYIEKELGAGHEGIKNGELCLPSNLIIYATMNTSDQSLFPMDSAFKRRWDWEYVPINYSKDIDSGKFIINIAGSEYLWVDFLEKVNDKIYDATNSEDKQMGNFFIKKSVDAKEFINKVMFYLWNEVCKEEYGTQRNFFRKGKDGKTEFKFTELFGANQTTILNEFMTSLGVEPTNKPNPEEPAAE